MKFNIVTVVPPVRRCRAVVQTLDKYSNVVTIDSHDKGTNSLSST